MLISDMTDSHLQNTIAVKERWWSKQIQPYQEEAESRRLKPLPLWKEMWYWVRRKFQKEQKHVQKDPMDEMFYLHDVDQF